MTYLLEHKADIIKYLPFFMQEYLEMQEITKTEDVEFNWLIETLMKMLDNQFITTCDEEGIARFEKVLDTLPYPNDSLEQRINNVITLWNNKLPYTMRTLKNMLDVLCGKDQFKVTLHNNIYEILIKTYFNDASKLVVLNTMLKRVIPANLTINSQNYMAEQTINNLAYVDIMAISSEYVLQQGTDDLITVANTLNTVSAFTVSQIYKIGGN